MAVTIFRAGSSRVYRFVPEARYASVLAELPAVQLYREAGLSRSRRWELGTQRLAEMLDYARTQVPAYAPISPRMVEERGLAAFPPLSKTELRTSAERLAVGGTPARWNRTSGSTNTPLRTALGPRHEYNQIVRWLRHWRSFGVDQPSTVRLLVPRAYRLRVFGGGPLRDLAGGHVVHQRHPTDNEPELPCQVVVANPHVLEYLHPSGWEWRSEVLVTSYEQRPPDLHRWKATTYGDVYGLSEIGDIAWQRVDENDWEIHDDLVRCEILDRQRYGDLFLGELVVTDLTNKVMPLIRYRTGDLVAGRCDEHGSLLALKAVVGRQILTAGTPLAGRDVMSTLIPILLDFGEPFRVCAGRDQVVVQVAAGVTRRAQLRQRLARTLPDVSLTVTTKRNSLNGLREVFAPPTPTTLRKRASASSVAPPALVRCHCADDPSALIALGGLRACSSGDGNLPRLICLPPGPGLGHQIIRNLHGVLVDLGCVQLVEYPGHGYGSVPPDTKAVVDAVAGALHADDVLIGHSWGAQIAIAAASCHELAGLVLISPPPVGRARRQWSEDTAQLRRWRRNGLDPEQWYRRYLEDYAIPLGLGSDRSRSKHLMMGVASYATVWQQLRREPSMFDLYGGLAMARAPVMVIIGTDDPLVEPKQLDTASSYAPVRVESVPGGHYPFLDCPNVLRRTVAAFLGDADQ
ncbi:MAG: alpha/beta fold hydrolase [Pseudonocardiales bacterium]|nr:alpha/beta fold hydrolase [Pseudonocardiales bacterium]